MTAEIKTMPSGAPAMQRGAWLDFLRFFVAGLIILYHFHAAGPVDLETVHPVFGRGFLLTDFFLLDSGYVIARIYATRVGKRMTYWEFVQKRFLRVVPGHLVMISGLAVLVLVAGAFGVAPTNPQYFDWKEFPAQFFLLQAYGVPGGMGWNAPTWSISALIGCYLLFPFLARVLWRLDAWKALGFGVGFFLIANVLAHLIVDAPVYWMNMKYGIYRAVPLFLLGMSLARFSETFYIPPRVAMAMGLVAFLVFAALEHFGPNGLAAMGLISVMVIAAAAIPVKQGSRFIQQGALAAYAMFITNEVVRIGYFGVADKVTELFGLSVELQWVLWAVGVLSAFIFAFGFYKFFDAPTQAWFNRPKKARQAVEIGGLTKAEPPTS
jgi:peptidoglycan/LPS O-acetylase OafA/YrhL